MCKSVRSTHRSCRIWPAGPVSGLQPGGGHTAALDSGRAGAVGGTTPGDAGVGSHRAVVLCCTSFWAGCAAGSAAPTRSWSKECYAPSAVSFVQKGQRGWRPGRVGPGAGRSSRQDRPKPARSGPAGAGRRPPRPQHRLGAGLPGLTAPAPHWTLRQRSQCLPSTSPPASTAPPRDLGCHTAATSGSSGMGELMSMLARMS